MFQRLILLSLALCVSLPLAANDHVNLYSARKEKLIKPLTDRFTEQTGIRVNLVTGKADALLKRLQYEGTNSPADLLITTDAGRLYRAKAAGLLQPVDSAVLTRAIPAQLRDPDQQWFGLSKRARPIIYNIDKVDPAQLSTYEALADPRWRKRVCIRSSNNIYNQSLVASMRVADGPQATQAWADGLVENFARKPQGGDRDQVKAAAIGICDIAIVNTYYLAQMRNSKDADQRAAAAKVKVFWPNQDGRGTHINVSGAGITKSARNRDAARQLLEFLVSDEAQRWYAQVNYEYPVKPGVPVSDTLREWGDFKADGVNLSALGEFNAEAVRIMDRAGWR